MSASPRESARRQARRLVARLKKRVPDRAWPLLLTLRSVPGDGPLVAAPGLRRALVLAAHPDDESMGCGGTIALLRRAGAHVAVVFATNGAATRGADVPPEEVGRRRAAEASAACGVLGVTDVRFLGLPDGSLGAHVSELAEQLGPLVSAYQPDGILVPWFLDGHPDHAAVVAALAATTLDSTVEVWGYETWTALPANRIVDITDVAHLKEAAMREHVTAGLAFDLQAGLGLSRWRSLHGLMGRGYAEGFLALPAQDWMDLRARVIG